MTDRIKDILSVILLVIILGATPFGLVALNQSGVPAHFERGPLIIG